MHHSTSRRCPKECADAINIIQDLDKAESKGKCINYCLLDRAMDRRIDISIVSISFYSLLTKKIPIFHPGYYICNYSIYLVQHRCRRNLRRHSNMRGNLSNSRFTKEVTLWFTHRMERKPALLPESTHLEWLCMCVFWSMIIHLCYTKWCGTMIAIWFGISLSS